MVSNSGQLVVVDAETVQSTQRFIYEERLSKFDESDQEILSFLGLPPDQPQPIPVGLLHKLNSTTCEATDILRLDHYYGCLTLRELLRSLNSYCVSGSRDLHQD